MLKLQAPCAWISLLALAFTPALGSTQEQNVPAGVREQLFEIGRSRLASPFSSRVELSYATPVSFFATSKTVYYSLVSDGATGEQVMVTIDQAGREFDLEALRNEEEREYARRFGKKTPDLAELADRTPPDKSLPVAVWLQMEDNEIPAWRPAAGDAHNLDVDEIRDISQRGAEEVASAVAKITAPVVEQLARMGISVITVDEYSPLLFTEVPPSLLPAIESIPRVKLLFSDESTFTPQAAAQLDAGLAPLIDMSAATVKAPSVWAAGYSGVGSIKIAVIEAPAGANDSNIDFGNTYLSSSNAGTYNTALPKSGHATRVAGVITSDRTGFRGIAYGASVLSGGMPTAATASSTSGMTPILNWAVNQGARILCLAPVRYSA